MSRRAGGIGAPGGGSALAKAARTPPPPEPPARPSTQTVQRKRKMQDKMSLALEIAADPIRSGAALAALKRDKFARTGESARQNWWRTWCRFHHALSPDTPPLPLSTRSIEAVSSLFKAAG